MYQNIKNYKAVAIYPQFSPLVRSRARAIYVSTANNYHSLPLPTHIIHHNHITHTRAHVHTCTRAHVHTCVAH
jgi:hypothetical protein